MQIQRLEKRCVLEIICTLHGLKSLCRLWALSLGDALRSMGFVPSCTDSDLWIQKSENYKGYDYIAAFADDLVIVAKDSLQCLNYLAFKFNLRNATNFPDFFLGVNLATTHGN